MQTTLKEPKDYVLGLDLGKSQDFTALAVLERVRREANHYGVRYLKRWTLGTGYTAIVSDLAGLVAKEPLKGSALVVDETGVGKAVVDLLRAANLPVHLHPVLITAGHEVSLAESGSLHVPKKELVSTLQVLLQAHRLKVAALPERETLVKELLSFKVKISTAGNEIFESWRERDHDDLVLATALAAWYAEKHPPWTPDAIGMSKGQCVIDQAPAGVFHDRPAGPFNTGPGRGPTDFPLW